MSDDDRFVFDCNVIVSALLFPKSIPGRVFFGALHRGAILISLTLLDDLKDVFDREKFDKYVVREDRDQLLTDLISDSRLVRVTSQFSDCRDEKDNSILELAVDGDASCIVTGDQDLLILHPFRGIPILTPKDALNWIERG